MSRKPPAFRNFPEALRCPYGPYMAVVEHIVDPDTFRASWDVGANDYPYRTCRLMAVTDSGTVGVDAPETNRPESREAGLAAKAWLIERMPVGTPIRIVTRPDPDSFGRFLVTAELESGVDIGAAMLASGHAVVWRR